MKTVYMAMMLAATAASCERYVYPPETFTQDDLEDMAKRLEVTQIEEGCLPAALADWRAMKSAPRRITDGWGVGYWLDREDGATRVVSAGPDGQQGSQDDLSSRPVAGPLCPSGGSAKAK